MIEFRYAVVALGDEETPATNEDVEAVCELIRQRTGFVVTSLSERVSRRLTIELLIEKGAL